MFDKAWTDLFHRIRSSGHCQPCLRRDAMHKRGLRRRAVSLRPDRLSVCQSVTFVDSVETNKHNFKCFSPPSSHFILVFTHQTSWQYSDGNPLTYRRRMQVACNAVQRRDTCDRQVLSTQCRRTEASWYTHRW